jgi:thiamine-monophosphate kinase
MRELALIDQIAQWAGDGPMRLGIGDDCAVYRPRASEDLVFTADFLIEDVHFRRATHPASAAGHKALARSLSDIAAMGANPRFCLLSLALPAGTSAAWIRQFFAGFLKLARRTGTQLAGGDLSESAKVMCDVTVCGSVPRGRELRRSGARPGHFLYVSGSLGKPWHSHLRPEPRLALGRALRERASAAIDISDGFALDLHRLCRASQVGAVVDRLPVARRSSIEQALYGGEDYELLFAMPSRRQPPTGCTHIGVLTDSPGVFFQGSPLEARGWEYF